MADQILCGDSLEIVKQFPADSFDTIITDPPYGLGFMGKDWDRGIPGVVFWKEFLRVCKPGAFTLVFGGTRTFHRLTCAIEDAGWEIRDCMMWLYGSGFPKSLDISKAIQKVNGVQPEKIEPASGVGFMKPDSGDWHVTKNKLTMPKPEGSAQLWDGWGTALKPAWEPIIVAMKPLDGTFAANAEKYGVAGLWIDGGRIETTEVLSAEYGQPSGSGCYNWNEEKKKTERTGKTNTKGRWPANLILDEEAGAMLGQPSRFFYAAKASKKERGEGCNHPTVKPLALMEYLCKLTKTPTGGIVFDPFAGSGTTGVACLRAKRQFVLIEKEEQYCEIARQRIAYERPIPQRPRRS
jgi:site-specific DNA-methyltransferase (adenine-specific)